MTWWCSEVIHKLYIPLSSIFWKWTGKTSQNWHDLHPYNLNCLACSTSSDPAAQHRRKYLLLISPRLTYQPRMNPKRLISLLCSISTTLFFMWMMYRSDPPHAGANIHYPGYKNCMKKQKVGFLKTHKCASSSLQNILMRYGLNNNLNFVLPSAGNYIDRYVW